MSPSTYSKLLPRLDAAVEVSCYRKVSDGELTFLGGAGAGGPGGLVAATGGAAGGGAGAGALGNLDWLRSNQQFLQLRGVIQQQPQMLEPILQSLANANPDMARLIGEHPEEFLQLLSEDNDGDMPLPPGAQSIAVTEEENQAIERVSDCTFFIAFVLTTNTNFNSLQISVSIINKLYRHTLCATRMRSLLQTFCSTNQIKETMMKRLHNKAILFRLKKNKRYCFNLTAVLDTSFPRNM